MRMHGCCPCRLGAFRLPGSCLAAALGAREVGAVLMSAFFGLNALNSSEWVLVPKNVFRGLEVILGLKKLTLLQTFFFSFQPVFFYEPDTVTVEQD